MARRLVESLSGVGEVHAAGRLLRRTAYELSIWDDEPGAGDGHTSVPTTVGQIGLTGLGEAVVLAGPEALILTIEDGRRLAFKLTSSTGEISGLVWLPPA